MKEATFLQYTMFKFVVFLVCVVSALSQELDETAAEGSASKKKLPDDEEGEMFIEGDEEVNKDEMPEGSSEGKFVVV